MLHTGCRVGDLVSLELNDVMLADRSGSVGQGFGADATFGMIELCHARQIEQDESNLERSPTAVRRFVNVFVEIRLLTPANLLCVDRVGSLEPHRPVHELECVELFGVGRR
jgi:hypothetical protein